MKADFALLVRLIADLFHSYAITLLIRKIRSTRSCSGLSLKTQYLYLIIFITRYLDIVTTKFSRPIIFYVFCMKLTYISLQSYSLYLMTMKYFYTYDKRYDRFNVSYLIVPSIIIPVFLDLRKSSVFIFCIDYLWTFSVLLESVCILPQLCLLRETGEAEVMTSRYIFCLGVYRLMYLLSWGIKKLKHDHVDTVMIVAGLLQTILYADFFFLYYKFVFSQRNKNKYIPN